MLFEDGREEASPVGEEFFRMVTALNGV